MNDKIWNPDTGRYVKITGSVGRRLQKESGKYVSDCPPGKFRNPETGRCVSRYGSVGSRIMSQYFGQSNKYDEPEVSHETFDIKTIGSSTPSKFGSHRKSTTASKKVVRSRPAAPTAPTKVVRSRPAASTAPKKVVRSRPAAPTAPTKVVRSRPAAPTAPTKISSRKASSAPKNQLVEKSTGAPINPLGPGVPTWMEPVAENCTKIKGYKLRTKLGEGEFGAAYRVFKADASGNQYVLKSQEDGYDYRQEIKALKALRNTGVVAELMSAWTCNGKGYMVIEFLKELPKKMSSDQKRYWYDELTKALDILRENNWLHVDTHIGNVMQDEQGNLKLIDFGMAVEMNQRDYPDHSLSKMNNKLMSLEALDIAQDINAAEALGSEADNMELLPYFEEIWSSLPRIKN